MEENNNIIFDININSIESLQKILLDKQYDFVVLEPGDGKVSVKFRKDGNFVDEKFIKYNIYSEILIKAKTISDLDVGVTNEEQEGTGKVEIAGKSFTSLAKVVPTNFGEKLFLKLKVVEEKKQTSEPQKVDLGALLGFFGAIFVVLLLLGVGFLTFIIFNAKTVEDVKFFNSLGIKMNAINQTLSLSVTVFFTTLTAISIVLFAWFGVKFLITKKIFKKKKAKYGILSVLLFILVFASISFWMILDQKVKQLPQWEALNERNIIIYDANLASIDNKNYAEEIEYLSLIDDDKALKLIGPIKLTFNAENLRLKEESKGNEIIEYNWIIEGTNSVNQITLDSEFSYDFTRIGNYTVSLKYQIRDRLGQVTEYDSGDSRKFQINYKIDTEETSIGNNTVVKTFMVDPDYSNILGVPSWYICKSNGECSLDSDKKLQYETIIGGETIIGIYFNNNRKQSLTTTPNLYNTNFDKVYVLNGESDSVIGGEIKYEISKENDKKVTFYVDNLQTESYVKEYVWRIEGQDKTVKGTFNDSERNGEIENIFTTYRDNIEISVNLITNNGETKRLTTNIDLRRELKIKTPPILKRDGENIAQSNYNENSGEFILYDFSFPANLSIDARNVKVDNITYTLKNVEFDYDSDGQIDEESKQGSIKLDKIGEVKITIHYTFKNIRNEEDLVHLEQYIYIDAIKKDYDVTFKINQNTEYAPAVIGFDASKSFVKDNNISKFIWDFGDGTSEEADAIISGHRYLTAGDYLVKLTIVTSNGQRYSTEKSFNLKPQTQKVKITSSIKKAPINQGIDFNSSNSVGDIVSYYWDFGDGEISIDANPTHYYKKPGTYKVVLKVDFRNRNVMEDSMNIIITN